MRGGGSCGTRPVIAYVPGRPEMHGVTGQSIFYGQPDPVQSKAIHHTNTLTYESTSILSYMAN